MQLAQQAAWFVHQLPFHPKIKFGLIHKKTNLYCIIFCSKLQISKEHVKKHANEVPKHQSKDRFCLLWQITLTMIKTFPLDLDTGSCNECSILPSIGFLIYPGKVSMAWKSKKQWKKTHGLLKGLCYAVSDGSFVPPDDARFTDCKTKDTLHRPSDYIRHFLFTIVHVGKPKPKEDKEKGEGRAATGTRWNSSERRLQVKEKIPLLAPAKLDRWCQFSGAYYSFSAPMPSSMTARQLLEEGSNTGTARVPRTSYFYAASLAGTPGYCRTEHRVSIPTPAARRLDLEVSVSCRWLQTHIPQRQFSSTRDDDQSYALAQRVVLAQWAALCHHPSSSAATPAPAHPHRSSQRTAKLASFAAIMSSHDDDDPTALLPSSLLSLPPLPLASQPGFWPPPFSGTKKKMRPNSPMFSHNREGPNCTVVEFQLLLPHKGREAMGWDDLMAEKNLQAANILPANRQSCRCCRSCRCCYRGAGDGLGSWRQILQQQQGYYSCGADVVVESIHCRREFAYPSALPKPYHLPRT